MTEYDRKLFTVKENKIFVKFDRLRKYVEKRFLRSYDSGEPQDYSDIIEKFVTVNNIVLSTFPKMSYSGCLKDIQLEDAKLIPFLDQMNRTIGERFRANTMTIHLYHCNEITHILYAIVKVFLADSTQQKIKFH